jgi:hypothetical protein
MTDPTEFNDDLPNPFSREEEDSEYETIRCPECGSIRWTLFTPDDQSICYANRIELQKCLFHKRLDRGARAPHRPEGRHQRLVNKEP